MRKSKIDKRAVKIANLQEDAYIDKMLERQEKKRCVNCGKEIEKWIAEIKIIKNKYFWARAKKFVCSEKCLKSLRDWGLKFKIIKLYGRLKNEK